MRLKLPCGGGDRGGSLSPTQQLHHNSFTISNNAPATKSSVEAVSRKPKAEDKPKSATKSLCAICLEPLSYNNVASHGQAIFTAQCSHAFHFTCISSNVRHGSVNCPICRAHWTQLPRDLNPPSIVPCNQTDPILRILDNSIANFRVHRRSSLRSARYDDDDPIEPNRPSYNQNRLQLSIQLVPLALPTFPSCMHLSSYSSSPLNESSPNGQLMPYLSTANDISGAAYLSVKLGHQQATDLVLVATPNGPHVRLLKQSMALVVFSLRSIDRLAIVTYSSTATRAFPLKRMTCHGKRAALQVIDRLFFMGDADPGPGLEKGIKILNDRAHQNPQSCILHLSDAPIRCRETPTTDLIHQFHVGCDYGTSFVMHEFEEFLARLLGGVIRDTHLRIGEDGEVVRLGELRGGEERRISIYLNKKESMVSVSYSYIEGGGDECLRTGKIEVSADYGKNHSGCTQVGGRDDLLSIVGRTSNVESWDYHDPYMARRWAKHLHGYRL